MSYLLPFISSFLLAGILTYLAIKVLPCWGFMGRDEEHHLDKKPVPRGGGIALFLTFSLLALVFVPIDEKLLGLLLGASLVFLINFLDDRYGVRWYWRLLVEFIACLVVIYFGIGMLNISNPFSGEALPLDAWKLQIGTHTFLPISNLFTIVWVLIFINMLNWLDGLDGLATGISGISALTLFGLALLPFVNQPDMADLSLILTGALAAFLFFNFYPAKIRLGDAGSAFLGFTLAVLAIFSSGKIATFFLVLGLPLLDVAWVLFRRVVLEHKSPFHGDQKHFHHRLLQAGLKEKTVVLIYYLFCASFGAIALLLQGAQQKLLAILALLLATAIFAWWTVRKSNS